MFEIAAVGKIVPAEAKEKYWREINADSFLCLLKRLQKASLVG
jgi:hypothetical protein